MPGDPSLEAFWMPFTANQQFKEAPRLLVSAKGMHYTASDGRSILDAAAGLWCVNAGHAAPRIVEALRQQTAYLDFAPTFQMGHPQAFALATRLVEMLPKSFGHVFYTNSGSEAVDSALKIALAYHRACGQGQRTRFIGRERGYHGVGFGGISVGGISKNRAAFAAMLPYVDHLPHTHDLQHNAFSRGQPASGAHLAEDLERLVNLHDASTIAAVIVEPVAGSTGVLIPPRGYLEKLRRICDAHQLLLIFDEVISGFGRLGSAFATDLFGVVPDMMTVAKGLTNGSVPAGAVFTRRDIYEALASGQKSNIELSHGYTYSGHPLAVAAAMATLDTYFGEDLFARAQAMAPYFEEALHSLRGLPHVNDLRNLGLIAGIELEPRAGKPGARAYEVFVRCFERGLLVRMTGDIIALSPPLIIEEQHIDELFTTLRAVLAEVP